jgi:predicted Zn-dependent protease
MGAANKSAPPAFLSTHPSSAQRINELNSKISTVLPLYEAAKRNTSSVKMIVPRI